MPICLSRIKRYSATDTSECALMVDPHGRLRLVTHTGPLERGARSGWAPAHHPLRDSWRESQDYSKSAHDVKVTIQSGHPEGCMSAFAGYAHGSKSSIGEPGDSVLECGGREALENGVPSREGQIMDGTTI